MRLPDTLVFADIQQLNRIAQEYALEVNLHSKNELIQSLLYQLTNKEELRKRVEGLPPEERQLLLLLLAEDREGYSWEELLHRAKRVTMRARETEDSNQGLEKNLIQPRKVSENGHSRKITPEWVDKMLRYGWLFQQNERNITRYRIPEDLKGRLMKFLLPADLYQSDISFSTQAFMEGDLQGRRPRSLDDLIQFLSFLHEEWVKLTKEGVIHKTQLSRLLLRLSTQEEPLSGKGWRFGYGRRFGDYPDLFSLLYDFAFYRGLIEEGTGLLQLTEMGRRVLHQEERVSPQEIFDFWRRLYRKPIPNLPSILSLMKLYLHNGIEKNQLFQQIEVFLAPFYYDSKEDLYQKRILAPLRWMDWLVERKEEPHILRLHPLCQAWYP